MQMNQSPVPYILIVDDDPRNRRIVETILTAGGYRSLSVDSGAALLAAVAATPPDAILLDLMMPGMDGFEVVRRLRATPATHELPVVMLTAVDDAASRARLAAAGVADFLSKPVDRWALLSCLERILRSH